MPKSEPPTFHLRLAPDLLKRIKHAAVENERSINAEIAASLERSFALSDGEREEALSLLSSAIDVLQRGRPRKR